MIRLFCFVSIGRELKFETINTNYNDMQLAKQQALVLSKCTKKESYPSKSMLNKVFFQMPPILRHIG